MLISLMVGPHLACSVSYSPSQSPEAIMRRRTFLASTAALAAPTIARGEASQVLRFVPQADLAVLDPIWTTTYQTRDHGFLVFDTLFVLDSTFKASPQMAEGASSDD